MPTRLGRSTVLVGVLAAIDVVSVLAALCIAGYGTDQIRGLDGIAPYLETHLGYLLAFLIAWPITAGNNRLYISRRRDDLLTLENDLLDP